VKDSRIRLLRGLFTLLFLVLAGRLFWIQVVRSKELREVARAQTRMRQILTAPRGEILGTDGSVLAADGPDGRREWPWGSLALPILGVVGRDGSGLMGLEYRWDRQLRGTAGWKVARRTGRGKPWPGFDEDGDGAREGLSVVTTLRPGLQAEVEKILADAVSSHKAAGGVALVLEAGTGDIAAAASLPAPGNRQEMLQGRVDAGIVNRTYEPGSTFKAVTLSAALDAGSVDLSTLFTVGPYWNPGDGSAPIHDAHAEVGTFDVGWCLEKSSNVCFAQIATRVGPERLYRAARDFGFGTPTGVEIPGEEGGILRTVDQWSVRTLPTLAIGQEVTVTPLQLASAYAAIANGGVLVRPRLVRALVDAQGDTVQRFPSRPVRRAVTRRSADMVLAALGRVVDSGTGRLAEIAGQEVEGKTGTSQKVDASTGKYFQDHFMASFVGIVGLKPDALVCLVVLDDPTANGHTGGLAAAPAFARIARFALEDPALPWGAGSVDAPGTLHAWLGQPHGRSDSAQQKRMRDIAGSEAPG
jgi:cell division protein FtsI/penicillin-binding protein 2